MVCWSDSVWWDSLYCAGSRQCTASCRQLKIFTLALCLVTCTVKVLAYKAVTCGIAWDTCHRLILVNEGQVWVEKLLTLLFIRLQMNGCLLAPKFRDGYNYRNYGEERAEVSLDTVFCCIFLPLLIKEFGKILPLGGLGWSFSKFFQKKQALRCCG